jgi:cytochrome P450
MQRADLIVSDVAEFTRDAHAKLSHPDFARQILVEEPEKFYKPRLIKAGVWCFCRTGLLTSDGAIWKQQRKLIQPGFIMRSS